MSPSRKAAKRTSRDDGFGRSSRFYTTPEGAKYPSVTTILRAINKPALVNWAAREERKMVLAALGAAMDSVEKGKKLGRMAFMKRVEDFIGAEKAHNKLRSKAGDIGTGIHQMAEWHLRSELKQKVGPEPQVPEASTWGYMAWDDWRRSVNLVPLHIEQTCYSDKYGYAGTFDLLCEMDLPDGTRGNVLADWKSGKAIYNEQPIQTAAYIEAVIEMKHATRPLHGLIVRVPKTIGDPEFETKYIHSDEVKGLFKVFLATYDLWKYLDATSGL